MHKRRKIPIIFSFLLIFLSAVGTREALAQPVVKFEVVVEVFTAGEPLCPHGVKPLNGAEVEVTFYTTVRFATNCCTIGEDATGQDSGITGEPYEVEEDGKKKTIMHDGRFVARGDLSDVPEDFPWEELKKEPEGDVHEAAAELAEFIPSFTVTLSVRVKCPPSDHPYQREKEYKYLVSSEKITGNGTPNDPYVLHFSTKVHFCTCEKKVGLLFPGGQAQLVAFVGVKEEEKVQVARQFGGEVVATVFVNDEPRTPPEPEDGVPVNPGDVVQLISTVGTFLGEFTFVPKEKIPSPPSTPVIECPSGKSTLVGVPGDFSGTAIEDTVITTGTVEALPVPGPKDVPTVTTPEGEVSVTPTGGLEPVIKTDDTLVAAGRLDNSAMGGNTIRAIDKNTGAVLGQAQIDMWRLAGASLNPPVVDKGGQTDLRLNIFGPPGLQVEVSATADEGLTPRKVTATAPISVLQSQGIGSFTATKSGSHNVSIRASSAIEGKEPVMGLPAWR